jgi:uncharacterized protein DUF3500/TAT (twin-arginine translocation) pathway-exported protein
MGETKKFCPDCGEHVTRRDFIKVAAGAAAMGAVAKLPVWASTWRDVKPEDLVKKFYESLNEKQKAAMCFPWDHKLRTKISNNWKIVEPEIGTFFTGDQQAILKDVFKGLVSPEWLEKWHKQMKDDNDGGGFEKYHVAVFGEPGKGKYEWVMTGRHITMRCDGESTENVAFGGPIFYGHAAEGFNEKPNHPGNVFWPQAQAASEIFAAMDGKQREKALLEKSPNDDDKSIVIKPSGPYDGIAVGELSKDQKALLEKTMRMLLAPYRESDCAEAMQFIKDSGGLDKLHLAFYKEGNLGEDEVWERWALRGPTMAWYFRGSPHVHTWVNFAKQA